MVLLVRHAEAPERRAELLADNDHGRCSERTTAAGAEGRAMTINDSDILESVFFLRCNDRGDAVGFHTRRIIKALMEMRKELDARDSAIRSEP